MKESPTTKKTSANPINPLLVTAETLAARYGVAEKTIRKWGQDGTLPFVKISRRCCRYPLEACDAIILRRRVRAISES